MADNNSEYIPQLQAEKDNLDPSFVHSLRLISEEIDRVQTGGGKEKKPLTDVIKDKQLKLTEKVLIPIKEFPKFNFVGKLLGPKGSTLKRLQEETNTKMSILGRGSMRDKAKEEEFRKEGGKYAHLNDELHLLVEAFAPPVIAHQRIAHALGELKTLLIPEHNEDLRGQQMGEMMHLNGSEFPPAAMSMRGRGRGMPPPRGRGGPVGLLSAPAGRGMPPPRGMPGARGAPAPRGAPRGAPAPRGIGSYGMARGASAYPPSGRGAPRAPAPEPLMERYAEESSYGAGYEDAYGEQPSYSGYEQTAYSSAGGDTQYFDYGHGSGGRETYDDGFGADAWASSATTYKAPPTRGKPDYRAHPYAASGRGTPRY